MSANLADSTKATSLKSSRQSTHTIAIAHGDGIGPEIMDAVLHVLREADAPLDYKQVTMGERA